MIEAITNFDVRVLDFIRDHLRFSFGDAFFKFFTHLADPIVAPLWALLFVVIGGIVYYSRHRRGERLLDERKFDFFRLGVTMGAALIIGLIICNFTLKPLIDRTRPYLIEFFTKTEPLPNLLMIGPESEKSFPSGHSVAVFEMALVVAWYCKKMKHGAWGFLAYAIALTIAFSRLYVGVHYPSDVVAGAIIGTICGILAIVIVNAIYKKIEAKNKVKVV